MDAVSGTNGQDRSRLDRIEEILERHSTILVSIETSIERQERANERYRAENEAAHDRFEQEDKRLLTAQILMNGAMQKMADAMQKALAAGEETWKAIERLELKMEETTGKLNALIATVDGIIRRPPDPNLPATAH